MNTSQTNKLHPQIAPMLNAGDKSAMDTLSAPKAGHVVIAMCADARMPSGTTPQRKRQELDALPGQMIVTIDGPARSGKNTAGELVAEAIGGVLVDSGRFYRSLTAAVLRVGINLNDAEAVGQFCSQALIYVPLDRDGGSVIEAIVAVNGRWYSKAEVNAVGAATPKVADVPQARELVNSALHLLNGWGRMVMLGRDIGARVFPETPFKIFLNAPAHVLEKRHRKTTGMPGAEKRNLADRKNTIRAEGALEIDTSISQPSAVCDAILAHLLRCARSDKNVAH